MWVRNQNKTELISAERIQVDENSIYAFQNVMDAVLPGEYETEERALQVLDQIEQRLIEGYRSDVIIGITREYRENVFQMPEK